MTEAMKKSHIERAELVAKRYKDVDEQLTILQNFKTTLGAELMDLMEVLDVGKVDGVKVVDKTIVQPQSMGEIRKRFEDDNITDLFTVLVDVDTTVENMRYVEGLQDTLIQKIKDRLHEEYKHTERGLKIDGR